MNMPYQNVLILSLALSGFTCFSQNLTEELKQSVTNTEGQKIEIYSPVSFQQTKSLSELADNPINQPHLNGINKRENKNRLHRNPKVNANALPQGDDPLWQKTPGTSFSRSPKANFNGLIGGDGIPLDPSGAAGPNHYVQAINMELGVFDKDGNVILSATNLSTLWSGSTDDGDPIVLYDKHADRWFISQFQSSDPNYQLLVAVSTTNDPTGTYYSYSYDFNDLPDYPKYSIWWDGYYFSINGADGTSGVLNRTKMLAGDASAELLVLTAPNVATNGFVSMLPSDADGQLPPNGSPCYFFNLRDDGWGSGSDGIQIYKMTTDWNTISNTKILSDGFIATSAFDTEFQNTIAGNDYPHISQKGTNLKLDAVSGVFYYRAQHRVWSGYNSVVLCHVVDVNNNDRGGMRWYEIRQDGTGKWSLFQEGTYSPTSDTDNRWMGSISMDDQGNIGMAYSVSGPNTYPSIRYTGRLATDPLGKMTLIEQNAFSGTGSQTANTGGDRYGDYSHLSLDPDGKTLWHTTQYVATDGYPRTRIYSFEIIGAAADLSENPYYTTLQTQMAVSEQGITISVEGLKNDESLTLDLFDLSGKLIQHLDVQPVKKKFTRTLQTVALPHGTYLLRYGNPNFQQVEKIGL